jgi:hypothetical protein
MRIFILTFLSMSLSGSVLAQDKAETREMVGQMGSRDALLVLHATQRPDGGWRMAGEYVLLPTLVRRYLEGERGPELGVTTLKEGTSAILFGRPATGELRGLLRDKAFKGTRYGPNGQERERFSFSEEFPSLKDYSAQVRCEVKQAGYSSELGYAVQSGTIQSLEWHSQLAPLGHGCTVRGARQQPFEGGLKALEGQCAVTFRDLGDYIKVAAENCAEICGTQAYLEPLLVDRSGRCRLLDPEAR